VAPRRADVSFPTLQARRHNLTTLSNSGPERHPPAILSRKAEAWRRQLLAYSALVISAAGGGAAIFLAGPAAQQVLAPILFAVLTFGAFTVYLFFKDGHSPLVNAGFFCAATALIYITLPALFYLLSGLEWSSTSDARLVVLRTDEEGVAGYVWRGTLYLFSFCLTYVLGVWNLRRRGATASIPIKATDVAICGFIVAACFAYRTAVELTFGVSFSQSNADIGADPAMQNLPLLAAQFTHNIVAIQAIAKLALIVALICMWQNKWAKLALVVLFCSELFFTLALSGPRTYFAFLVLAALLSYHKLVRPITVPVLAAFSILFLSFLLAYGYLRDYSGNIDFSTANEFQVLMGTALHMRNMVEGGLSVPSQVLWSELLMLIPQQLLPIEKMDPSNWYLVASGLDETGSGYMFGVQSQAEVGWGNAELFIRGVVLALVLSFIHRQYSKHESSFIATVSYVWLLTAIYYSYRAGTFYWLTYVVFRLLVFICVFLAIRHALSRLSSRASNTVAV
jgi:hypothetical protein